MHSININLDSKQLKTATFIRKFQNEQNWKPNSNLSTCDLIPAAYYDTDLCANVLFVMRWGYDKFGRTIKKNGFAKSESLLKTWCNDTSFIVTPCIIPAKGFYVKYQNENKSRSIDYYYFKPKQERFLYFAAIFLKEKVLNKIKYSVLILTKSTDNDENLFAYHNRMPVMIEKRLLKTWMQWRGDQKHLSNFVKNQNITLSDALLIGKALENPEENDEAILLQTKEEWQAENEWQTEAADIDWCAINY